MYKLNEVLCYSILCSRMKIKLQSNVKYCPIIGQHNKVLHPIFLWSLNTTIMTLIRHPFHPATVPFHLAMVPLPKKTGTILHQIFAVPNPFFGCDALISRDTTDRKQQIRSECCPENRAICSDGWKRSNTHTRHAPQTTGSQEGGNKRVFARPKVLQEVHQLYAQQQRPKEESEHPKAKGS